jgi:RNase P subunit RPR2
MEQPDWESIAKNAKRLHGTELARRTVKAAKEISEKYSQGQLQQD